MTNNPPKLQKPTNYSLELKKKLKLFMLLLKDNESSTNKPLMISINGLIS